MSYNIETQKKKKLPKDISNGGAAVTYHHRTNSNPPKRIENQRGVNENNLYWSIRQTRQCVWPRKPTTDDTCEKSVKSYQVREASEEEATEKGSMRQTISMAAAVAAAIVVVVRLGGGRVRERRWVSCFVWGDRCGEGVERLTIGVDMVA